MGFCSRKINTTRSSATMKTILPLLLLVSVKRKITQNRVRKNVAGHFLTISESWSVCSDLVERKMIPTYSPTPISWEALSVDSMASYSSNQ